MTVSAAPAEMPLDNARDPELVEGARPIMNHAG